MPFKTLLFCLLLVSAHCQDEDTTEDVSCTLEDGSIGECVPFYLCSNGTINDIGINVIDIRADDDNGGCPSYFQSCCQSADKQKYPITPKTDIMYKRQECGWQNPEGVGFLITGNNNGEAEFAEFPWMVVLLLEKPTDDADPNGNKINFYVGGGSLINPSVVLTAAHYVATNNSIKVRAGEWDTQTTKEIYPHQDRKVASKELHENFHPGALFFDIAVLFLSEPFTDAPNIGVVCLPPPKQIPTAGTRCYATGWGKDKFSKEAQYQIILKKIEVPIVEHKACQVALRKTRLGTHFKLHTTFMCAGGEKDMDACRGDGGSPLSCPIEEQKNRFVQTGIVAWGIGCGEENIPGVYVDVAYLRDWVDEKVIAKGFDTKSYTL